MGAKDRAYQKVKAFIDAWPLVYQTPVPYAFAIPNNSTLIWVSVFEYGDDNSEAIVDFRIHLVQDVPLSSALYRHVATSPPAFGALSVWTDDQGVSEIMLSYEMLADYLDEPEFRQALTLVATEADQLDDELAATFGGHVWSPQS